MGQFDGLALVIDTHGGRGGSIRGFLNDGTTDYKSHRSVDSLAFGHCDYAYRNLGRPSVLKMKYTNSFLEVTVDDKVCFSTDKIALPVGNTFGITAATPENPDSFEIFKFILSSASGQSAPVYQNQAPQQPVQNQVPPANLPPVASSGNKVLDAGIAAQFVDLGGRLQLTNKATSNILQELRSQAAKAESRHAELQQNLATKGDLAALDARLQRIETLLQSVQRDIQGRDYSGSFSQLHDTLRSSHLSLTESLQGHLLSGMSSSTSQRKKESEPTDVIYSNHRLDPSHGLLHLPGHRLPGPPRCLLHHLQEAPRQYA